MCHLECDEAEIERSLKPLLGPDQVVELRILNASRNGSGYTETLTGYFDTEHLADLAKAAKSVPYATGYYWTLNPVIPDLLARAHNRLKKAAKGESTGDHETTARRWLPIDLDPRRPAGISSTDEEKARALALASIIVEDLTALGWPAPVRLDSGNGAHLLFRVDLPTNDGGLVERCLKALDERYSDAWTKVDTSVHNPSRIWKLPGTPSRKGDHTPTRPHRMARLLDMPQKVDVVSRDILVTLAGRQEGGKPPKGPAVGVSSPSFDLESWINQFSLDVRGPKAYQGGRIWIFRDCPWRSGDGETAFIVQHASGAVSAGCQHETCPGSRSTGNHWRELRERFDPPSDTLGGHWPTEPKEVPCSLTIPPPPDNDRPFPAPLEVLDPSTFMACEPPPIRWLLEGLLPWGVPAILAAKSNAGKSLLAMQVSMAVAVGRGVFGLQGSGVPLNVLVLGMEDDRSELQRRFRRCLDLFREEKDWGPKEEATLLENWRAVVPIWASSAPKTLTGLREILLRHASALCLNGRQMGLIVLDTFASLSEGEENRAEVQQAFWANCHTLADETGCTPLVIHHVRKLTGTGGRGPSMPERLSFENLRGSSAIVAGARGILQAEPLSVAEAGRLQLDEDRAIAGNYLILALTKLNGGPKGSWMALEQRQSGDPGAGFFIPIPDGEKVCAALQSKAAVAKMTLAEEVLLSIAGGQLDRDELARRHWPGESVTKATSRLKNMLQDLRRKYHWLQAGKMELTLSGFTKAQALQKEGGESDARPP